MHFLWNLAITNKQSKEQMRYKNCQKERISLKKIKKITVINYDTATYDI